MINTKQDYSIDYIEKQVKYFIRKAGIILIGIVVSIFFKN